MPRHVVVFSHSAPAVFFGRLHASRPNRVELRNARLYQGEFANASASVPKGLTDAFALANIGPKPGSVSALVPHLGLAFVPGDAVIEVTPRALAAWQGAHSLDVVLTSWGLNKIAVIKAIRELTGLGLKEAKDLAEAVAQRPQAVKRGLAPDAASDAAQRLREAGAAVQLVPSSA